MNTKLRSVKRELSCHVGTAALVAYLALGQPATVSADEIDAPVAFSISAGSLGAALNAVALQANLQIFFEEATVQGLTAPALGGTLSAREALGTLLDDSGLEFIQNADNTILIRAKVRHAAHRAKARPKPVPTEREDAAQSAPPPITIPDKDGAWMLRARGVYLDPRNDSNPIALGNPALAVPGDGVRTNGRMYPELDLEYFWSAHWSAELAVTASERQDLDLAAAPSTVRTRVGRFRQQMNDLTLKYTFMTSGAWRPYIGAGVDYTLLSRTGSAPYALGANTVGPAASAGLDLKIGTGWFLNADVKWSRERPYLEFGGVRAGQLQVDPVRIGLGIGYRFGGTPAHTIPAPVAATPAREVEPPSALPEPPVKDSDGDGIPDSLDRCPGTPPGLKVDANGCEIDELVLEGVNFETGSAHLTPDSTATLEAVAAILRQRPNAQVEVHGYTDSVGSDTLNLRLSEQRARAVVEYFEKAGVSPDVISARGFGKAEPVASNATAAGRARNRRVTVRFHSPVLREGH